MKKVLAILLVSMLVMGSTVAFADTMQEEIDKTSGAIGKFWTDLVELVTDRIPNTYKDLSPTGTKQSQATTTTQSKSRRYYK